MQVYVTVPSQDVADHLAGSIIHQKLAACVNIIPGLQSVYFWEGRVTKDQELLLMIKTQPEQPGPRSGGACEAAPPIR